MTRPPSAARGGVDPAKWKRILAVRLDNIGDVVMLGPALRALRAAAPRAQLTLLASPAGAEAAPLLPWVDDVIVHRAVWQDASGALPFDPEREVRFARRLAARRFDAAFVFTSFSQSPHPPAYLLYLAGVPVRIGESHEFAGAVLSHPAPPADDALHQTERSLRLLEGAGIEVTDRALELRLAPEHERRAAALLDDAGVADPRPVLAAPSASCSARTYPPERMGRALAAVAELAPREIVVVGRDRERALVEHVVASSGPHPRLFPLVGRTSVPELAAIAARASLVVCNNSGPLHIAEAFRRPLVVLYSGTDLESQWRPRDAPAALLRRPTWCSPCYEMKCPYSLQCLDIPPEEVADAAMEVLSRTEGVTATA